MPLLPLPIGTPLCRDAYGRPKYEITAELGVGGFGITYLARNNAFGTQVVIKELACDAVAARDTQTGNLVPLTRRESQFDGLRRRFLSEATILHELRHKRARYVVHVDDVFEDFGTVYYVMARVASRGTVPVAPPQYVDDVWISRCLRYARQILIALSDAHSSVALHGDIKPSNLLIDENDDVVLIDFGTARRDEELMRTVRTAMYTKGYAPPELMNREQVRTAGPGSDLYSWAMVVYGMFVRHPLEMAEDDGVEVPWPHDPATRVMAGAGDVYARAAVDLRAAGVPAAVADLVQRCLAIDVRQRPQTALQVLEEFERAQRAGHVAAPVAAHPRSVPATRIESIGGPVGPQQLSASVAAPAAAVQSSRAASPRRLVAGIVAGVIVVTAIVLATTVVRRQPAPNVVEASRVAVPEPVAAAATTSVAAPPKAPPLPPVPPPAVGGTPSPSTQQPAPAVVTGRQDNAGSPPPPLINQTTLYGVWGADFQQMLAQQEMAEEERALAMALMGSMEMTFTFEPSGVLTIETTSMGETKSERGSYVVDSMRGSVVRATMTGPDGQSESMVITFDGPNAFTLRPATQEGAGAPEQIPFRRE